MQAAQQTASPVSFEIQIERERAQLTPAIKQRLEQAAQQLPKEQLTLQMIQEKLERAYERKAQHIASQMEQHRENKDRIGLIQERKSSQDRAQSQHRILVIEKKLTTASAKRHEQLSSIQERAHSHNVKVLQIRERKTSQEKADEERAQQEFTQKLTSAEVRQNQFMASIQEKAKEHNLMALARAQAHQQEELKEIDSKKSAIEEKLNRAANNRVDPSEKAREHNQKVQEKVTIVLSEMSESADAMMARIETKLGEAASRRESVIEQVKTVAAKSSTPKATQSPQKATAQTQTQQVAAAQQE